MGVPITDLLIRKEIDLKDLSNKVIAVDASLFLYQFVTTIRQRDGSLLKDSKGNVTSHLNGVFSRSVKLMQQGLKLVYVFDGKTPELKRKERERRMLLKEEAQKMYEQAIVDEDIDSMKKYASRTSRITPEMFEETKMLLKALGIPIIEAPCEAEAQAAYMVRNGDCYAVATQDNDVLMFGTPLVVRNLSMLGKRKQQKTLQYKTIKPELVNLSEVLNELGIDNDQLVALCMLVGTDFNVGGIKGIGPKNALRIVKKYEKDFEALFKEVRWDDYFEASWNEVFYLIKQMPITKEYDLRWGTVNETLVRKILVEDHDFSIERVNSTLSMLKEQIEQKQQKSLFDY